MKRTNLISRLCAAALALAMLAPAFAPQGAGAESAVENLWHYQAKATDADRELFRSSYFPNNVSIMHSGKDGLTRAFHQYSYTVYRQDGPFKLSTQAMQFGTDPAYGYSSKGTYTGRPVEILNENVAACKLLDAVRFELGAVNYPIVTRRMGALNLSFTYLCGQRNLGLMDEFKVYLSLDGRTWLKDGAGIRSHEFLGAGASGTSAYYMFRLETENLLDAAGFTPGDRILKIKVEPFETENTQATELQFYTMDLNAYQSAADFERLVPRDERKFVHVGEEVMRQIVVDEAVRTANVPWTTDSEIHAKAGGNHIIHIPGIPYRGCVYESNIDSSRELFESKIVNGKWLGGSTQDTVQGMDCQTFVYNAASRVSRALAWACMYTAGAPGMSLVGKEFLNIPENGLITFTNYDVIRTNTQQDLFRSYALAKPGDHELTFTTKFDMDSQSGKHVRVVTDNHVEYNADGTIDGANSYVLSGEQVQYPRYEIELADGSLTYYSPIGSDAVSKFEAYMRKYPEAKVLYAHSSKGDSKQSYNALYNGDYVIYTNDYYPAGDIELQNVEVVFAPKQENTSIADGGVVISAVSNYRIVRTAVRLEDLSTGEVLYDDDVIYSGSNQRWAKYYDSDVLNAKLAALTDGSYRLSLVTHSGPFTAIGQTKVPTNVDTYDFTVTGRAPAGKVTLSAPASAAKGERVEVAVNTAAAADSAQIDVKFDTAALHYESAAGGEDVFITCEGGLIAVIAVDAGVPAGGTLAKLTFTAKTDIPGLSDAVKVKSARTVTAEAANTDDAVKAVDGGQPCASARFGDVYETAWYHRAVDYAVENGIMSGYNSHTFGPDDALSRAMVVQVLYNREGKPPVIGEDSFPDVKRGQWYCDAARWGAEKGVVSGYGDGRFGPDDSVTVEQVAVILHNYAGKPAGSGAAFTGAHSDWADDALRWAADCGILEGTPLGTATDAATRAQTAQMLMNFLSR